MSRWFRIWSDLLNDRAVQQLSGDEFKAEFMKAVNRQPSKFDAFLKVYEGRLPRNEWAAIRLSVFNRDNHTCRYCGAQGVKLECDHIVPLAKGGSHHKSNLATACRDCNRKKAAKTLEELGWELVA